MFAVIAVAKIAFVLLFDQLVDVSDVLIPTRAQCVGDALLILNLGTDKPDRVNERKIDMSLPLLTQIPEVKVGMFLAETNSRIAGTKIRKGTLLGWWR